MSSLSLITRSAYATGRRPGLPKQEIRLSTPRRVLREAQLCRNGTAITTATIVRIFGVSRSTAKRDIRLLREYGFL